jgi:threonine/homoserine/homoserine lactone efflux protein
VDLLSSLPAFVLAVVLISASPGPAMALVFRRAALRGLAGAVPTVLGLELGLYGWALFAGAGPRPAGRRWWGAFAEGVVVQLANPKAAVFMIAFYPQFVPADGPVFATTALLGLLQVTLETVLYLGLAAGVARAGTWFRRPRIRRRLEAVSGTVLVGLGLRVAASGR